MLSTSSALTTSVLLVISKFITSCCADTLLHTVSHSVGAENFTYYELHDTGDIRVVLESVMGDADLYISDSNSSPDYDNYELQSVTCGLDQVMVPSSMKRPVSIGVYGHSAYETSQYVLRIFLCSPSDNQVYPENHPSDTVTQSKRSQNKATAGRGVVDTKEDDESVIWTIFVGILKVLFDVLV